MKPETNLVKQNLLKTTRKRAIDAANAARMGCWAVEQINGFPDHLESGFRGFMRECASPGCPLFPWRPYQVAG